MTQLGEDRLEWVAEIGGVRRQWIAQIIEQVPDRKVAWAAVEGATNAGEVSFADAGEGRAEVRLVLEFEPEGFLENVADKLHLVENQAERDLEKFKEFIESEGRETGAWRGTINEGAAVGTPGVEDASASRGDSGTLGAPSRDRPAGEDEDVELGVGFTGPASTQPMVNPALNDLSDSPRNDTLGGGNARGRS